MSEEREIEEQEEISDLDYVDGKMKMLGISLNLLDPEGTFKSVPSEEVLIEIMRAVRDDYRQLSDAILALREEDTEPTPKHDGNLGDDYFVKYHYSTVEIQIRDNQAKFVGLTFKQAL